MSSTLEGSVASPPRWHEIAMRTSVPGVATGLAWTPVGGDILFIEAARTPGSGKLILTGQLGEVMRESVQAALTLVKGGSGKFSFHPPPQCTFVWPFGLFMWHWLIT